MPEPRSLADTLPSPWMAFVLALLGVAALVAPWEPVFRAVGALLLLGGGLWLAWVVKRNRRLLLRVQEAVPLPDKGEELIRELPKAWSSLQHDLQILQTRLQNEIDLRQTLLAHLNVGVIQLDPERRIEVFNPAAEVLLGASSRLHAGGDVVLAFREPESLRCIDLAYQGALSEWDLRRPPRSLHIHALPFEHAWAGTGERSAVLLTLYDMTRQEALELTRQKFISNASHELKTPVTSIRIAAENALDGPLSEDGEASLRSIMRSVDRMTLLLNDISELSRIETGALVLEPKEIQVRSFSEGLMDDMKPQAQARHIQLTLDLAPDAEELELRADPLRLQQLLENLLSNAIKFSPEHGTVKLRIWRDARWLAWSVEDQGPGIGPSDAARIFERFYRAPSARGVPGTGLGLSIVKHLSLLMNGEVDLKSQLGQGATFTLRLPCPETKR